MHPTLTFVRLHPEAATPHLAYDESAAYDLSALLLTADGRPNNTIVAPNSVKSIRTGLAMRPPPGHLLLVCSRSGMARESGVFVANAPGVIDPTYTGELHVLLFNGSHKSLYVRHGDRIAQVLCIPFATVKLEEAKSLPDTVRGERGFGSSGA